MWYRWQSEYVGYLLVTVPADQFLWSEHDEINHHKRRYTLKTLHQVITNSGYTIKYSSYFNFWLFPIVAGIRLIKKILLLKKNNIPNSDLNLPHKIVNRILTLLFASESYLISKIAMPFGVSIILIAEKT